MVVVVVVVVVKGEHRVNVVNVCNLGLIISVNLQLRNAGLETNSLEQLKTFYCKCRPNVDPCFTFTMVL